MHKHSRSYNHPSKFFKKRSYTFRTFFTDVLRIIRHRKYLRNAHQSDRVSKNFSEHLMLVVTGINGCIYCEWGHTTFALQAGSTLDEIHALLVQEYGEFPPEEKLALVFAQHYAESAGQPSKQSIRALLGEYGLETGRDIIVFCEMITIGNLLGNSVSAFFSRLEGIPPEHGSFFFELAVFLFGGFFFDRYMNRNR
ncbi:carboxymuconolactone decarboxylase family protein [Candidatus Heimdallarchaeota archaeon B3_Heim]|nr:MAG: carboxymuconolactone decarboxylase family protein [Candidatus Heimdallarchaeota archaeon B3_Heim]